MIIVRRWDFTTNSYHPFALPAGAVKLAESMDTMIKCAICAKDVVFGDCYTSGTIHDDIGLGFAVCDDCHESESISEQEAKMSLHKLRSRIDDIVSALLFDDEVITDGLDKIMDAISEYIKEKGIDKTK